MSPFLKAFGGFWAKAAKEFVFWLSLLLGVALILIRDEPLRTMGVMLMLFVLLPCLALAVWRGVQEVRKAKAEAPSPEEAERP